MDRKMDPQKIDFRRVLKRVRAGPGGMCGPHLALEFEDYHFRFSTPCPPRGRRIPPRTPPVSGLGFPSRSVGLATLCVKEVGAGQKMETISTKSRSEATETDTQSDKKEALRILEGLQSPVGARTPNREQRDYFFDVILLPNGDPVGVHF